jgi:hypothetical protein
MYINLILKAMSSLSCNKNNNATTTDINTNTNTTIDNLSNLFLGFIEKKNILEFQYKHGGQVTCDYRLEFNNNSNNNNSKDEISKNNVKRLKVFKVRLLQYSNIIKDIFSKHLIVFWFPKNSKAIEEVIRQINEVSPLIQKNEFASNKNFSCFVTEYALAHLPSLNSNEWGESCQFLPLIKGVKDTYVLLRQQKNFYNLFGGLHCLDTPKPKFKCQRDCFQFGIQSLEQHFGIKFDSICKKGVTRIDTINKSARYDVLNRSVTIACTRGCILLTLEDLDRLDIFHHPFAMMLREKEGCNFIKGTDFILIKLDKSTNTLVDYDDATNFIAASVPGVLRGYNKRTLTN